MFGLKVRTLDSERKAKENLGGGEWQTMSSSGFPPKLNCLEKCGKDEEKLEIYFQVHEEFLRRAMQWARKKADMFQDRFSPL